jgi:hypothetical protein
MLIFTCQTEIALRQPDEQSGFITWFDVRVVDEETKVEVGHVRFARILGGEAMNRGVSMLDILDSDGDELVALHDVFFDGDVLKEVYENGNGQDCIYFSEIELDDAWRGRTIEDALVQRVIATLGAGCAIAIIPVEDRREAARWERSGFTHLALAPSAKRTGYVVNDLSKEQPFVVETNDYRTRFAIEDAEPIVANENE